MIDPREFARALIAGSHGAEHSPQMAGALIAQLVREKDMLAAQVAEMERVTMSSKTQGHLRDSYARGFRGAQRALAARVPPGSVAEHEIMSINPDFGEAGAAAQAVAA